MPSPTLPSARGVAAEVLVRVLRDGAYAAAALDAELARAVQLEARDRALATELAYGTLRLLQWLEGRVAKFTPRGISKLDVHVRAHMLSAAYQLLVLTRVPAFAAVSEAVTAVRHLRGERVAGFCNAVLRKVAREPRPSSAEIARAALASAEPALAKALVRAVGEEGALRIVAGAEPEDDAEAGPRPPPNGLRVEGRVGVAGEDVATRRESCIAALRAARPEGAFEPGRVSPLAILARGAGRLTDLPGYAEGAWTPQEEGSQIIALALGARPGEVVLDACAGRGNKTGLLARAVGPDGAVDAADLHPNKLARLEGELGRIGLGVRATHPVDWSAGAGDVTGPYDRVLVDAPCSGVGTVARRPELLLRRAGTDLASLAALQKAILARTAPLVRPGGRLVYAVCSVLVEEAEAVVAIAPELGLVPMPFDAPVESWLGARSAGEGLRAGAGTEPGSAFRLLPHVHGTDGYFVASFRKA